MIEKNKLYIGILVVIVALLGSYYVVNNDALAPSGDEDDIVSDDGNVADDKDGVTELPPTENKLYPDLNRPIPEGADPEVAKRIGELIELVKDDDTYYNAWLDLASFRKVAGDVDGATQVWIYLVERFPREIAPHINIGDVSYFNYGDYAQSESAYRMAITLKPDYFPTYLRLFELYRDSYVEKADLADDILLEGLGVGPGEIPLMAHLGEYYESIGKTDLALKYYKMTADEALAIGDTRIHTSYSEKISALENSI